MDDDPNIFLLACANWFYEICPCCMQLHSTGESRNAYTWHGMCSWKPKRQLQQTIIIRWGHYPQTLT